MWIDGKFMTEPELQAHIKQVKEEAFREGYLKAVDTMAQETATKMQDMEKTGGAYRKELIETLQTLSGGDTKFAYSAHLRLEELTSKSHTNICQVVVWNFLH